LLIEAHSSGMKGSYRKSWYIKIATAHPLASSGAKEC